MVGNIIQTGKAIVTDLLLMRYFNCKKILKNVAVGAKSIKIQTLY
jgi:hypothetical protein